MAKLIWDLPEEKRVETGIDHVALFVKNGDEYETGVAWNGITAINESPSGAEPTVNYADNKKYLNLVSEEEFSATLEAYMYPDEFSVCDGSAYVANGVKLCQQLRKRFGLVYRTKIMNDLTESYKIHIVYNCLASPSGKDYATISDSPEAITFSWEMATEPVVNPFGKRMSHLILDSRKINSLKMTVLLLTIYGMDDEYTNPTLPSIEEVASIVGVPGYSRELNGDLIYY